MKTTKCRTRRVNINGRSRKLRLRRKRAVCTFTGIIVFILCFALRAANVMAELPPEKEKETKATLLSQNDVIISSSLDMTNDEDYTDEAIYLSDGIVDNSSNISNADDVIALYTSNEISKSEKRAYFEFYSSEMCKDFERYYSARLNRYVSPFELYHLTRITYSEAGTQGMEGKIAVAATILNRMEDQSGLFENTIYDVIFQKYQFSSADILDDERETAGKYFSYGGEQKYEDLDPSIKAECLEAAKQALDGVDPTRDATGGGALFFFNPEYCSEEQLAMRTNIPYDNIIIIEEHWFHREWPAA